MECPRCGVAQPDGCPECSACGVIFARWVARQERSRQDEALFATGGSPHERGVPQALVIVFVVILLFAGGIWVIHRRAARAREDASADADGLLNRINQEGLAKRQQRRQEMRQEAFAAAAPAREAAQRSTRLPYDISESEVRTVIERCPAFAGPVMATLPKTFVDKAYNDALQRYPYLFPFVRDEIISYDPPLESIYRYGSSGPPLGPARIIQVVITAQGRLRLASVDSSGSEYLVSLGDRSMTTIKEIASSRDQFLVYFSWSLPASRIDPAEPDAMAEFARGDGSWKLSSISLLHDRGSTVIYPVPAH